METLRHVVIVLHLIGFAFLLGAWAAEAIGGKRRITRVMHLGLAISGITGFALAAPWGMTGDPNYVKIGVKLAVLLLIGGLLGAEQRMQRTNGGHATPVFWMIGILAVANASVAVIWT